MNIRSINNRVILMKTLLVAAFIGLTLLFFTSCNDGSLLEFRETVDAAEDNATLETEFTALYDLLDDVSATDPKLGKTGSTILPSGATLNYLDTSWIDGDGKEFLIDFGPLGTVSPKGMLCKDGKYRAGKVRITLNKPFMQVGSILDVKLDENDQYYSGDGEKMTQLTGNFTIIRTGQETLRMEVVNGIAKTDDGRELKWTLVNRTVQRTKDAGPGVWGDHFKIEGEASGIGRNGDEFTVSITEPLIKKMETGCASAFVKGRLTISVNNGSKIIKVNYDPFNNEACDRVAEADINGRKTTFTVK